ncbi:uncharacterized protein [Pyrus communis]|uniref:uncharacterized protein n=1 Tax=Pyrus communis TaxID=23211 RepID=UPI0035C11FDA
MVSMQTIQKWSPPDTCFLKCNFDGAWDERSREGGVGVIIRNCRGEFLAGLAAVEEDVGSALQAELLATCSVNSFMQLGDLFEGDSSLTLAAMNGEGDDHSILGPIVNDNRVLLRSFVHAMTNFIRREGNGAAHRLARAGLRGTGESI